MVICCLAASGLETTSQRAEQFEAARHELQNLVLFYRLFCKGGQICIMIFNLVQSGSVSPGPTFLRSQLSNNRQVQFGFRFGHKFLDPWRPLNPRVGYKQAYCIIFRKRELKCRKIIYADVSFSIMKLIYMLIFLFNASITLFNANTAGEGLLWF